MNFKNGGVQIWQNVCIAAKALHSDTMFPTPTAKPAEPGSLISERSAPLSTESTRQFRSVPVAFARARSKEAENASRRKNIRKPLHIEGASLPSGVYILYKQFLRRLTLPYALMQPSEHDRSGFYILLRFK